MNGELLRLVNSLRKCFDRVKVTQIFRGHNSHTGSLATLASFVEDGVPWVISVEVLSRPSIECPCSIAMASVIASSWMDPIILYIANGSLLYEPKEAKRI